MNQWLVAAGVAAVMSFGANQLSAQPDNAAPGGGGRPGRGNFDPAQFQQRMLERTKEVLEVTDDAATLEITGATSGGATMKLTVIVTGEPCTPAAVTVMCPV